VLHAELEAHGLVEKAAKKEGKDIRIFYKITESGSEILKKMEDFISK